MKKYHFIAILTLSFLTIMLFFGWVPPIPQDPSYHNFADQRFLLGIPNFCDVFSNLAFLIPAILGTRYTIQKWEDPALFSSPFERWMRLVFFAAVFSVCFGSAYYHINPNNHTLLWDRLPMAISFMAIATIIINIYMPTKWIPFLFALLQLLGITSVLYWSYTESLGEGDLRLYALVQFMPLIALPIIIGYNYKKGFVPGNIAFLLLALMWYLIAKITEHADHFIFISLYHGLSGHTLKHIAAAIAVLYLHKYCTTTDRITSSESEY